MDELQGKLRVLTRYLNENELFYVFTGELALRMVGCADAVGTIELLANLTSEERAKLLNFLQQEGFSAQSRWLGPISLGHRAGGIGLRLRLAGSAADMATIGRRVAATLGYVNLFIPSYEDLILNVIQEGVLGEPEVARIYSKFRNYLDMEYLVISAKEGGIYPRFVKMKIRAEK
jgi:hypothetical protein